jgi:hypothetical protein
MGRTGGKDYFRTPLTPSPCVVCTAETPATEGRERRKIKWAMGFLGGEICLRCHIGLRHHLNSYGPDWREMVTEHGEKMVLGWLARQLVNKGRGARKPPQPRTAHAKKWTPEHRKNIMEAQRAKGWRVE